MVHKSRTNSEGLFGPAVKGLTSSSETKNLNEKAKHLFSLITCEISDRIYSPKKYVVILLVSLPFFKSGLGISLKTSFNIQGDYLPWCRNNSVKLCDLCHGQDKTGQAYLSPFILYLQLCVYVHSPLQSSLYLLGMMLEQYYLRSYKQYESVVPAMNLVNQYSMVI